MLHLNVTVEFFMCNTFKVNKINAFKGLVLHMLQLYFLYSYFLRNQ